MTRSIMGVLVTMTALAACHADRRDTIAVEVTGDAAHRSATMTCRESTSGTCHAVFLSGGETKTIEAAPGTRAIADGLAAGSRFCVGTTAPDPGRCKAAELADGRQIIRHDRRESR